MFTVGTQSANITRWKALQVSDFNKKNEKEKIMNAFIL